MHLEFLVEELSAEAALYNLVPKILGEQISFVIHSYRGKSDLLNKLSGRLKGYAGWLPEEYQIVVLIDEDREDCNQIKMQLEDAALEAGLVTKTKARPGTEFQVLNRVAIEELEAWFFGDVPALVRAYPRIPQSLDQKARYRNPDTIAGGTWEALERILQQYGYYKGGLEKPRAAGEISQHMDPFRNRSKSFQVFRDGLLAIVKRHK